MPGGLDWPGQPVKSRLVLFFPGFEPLGAKAHRGRFEHAVAMTGPHYGSTFSCGPLEERASGLAGFSVRAGGPGWNTSSDIVIFDWSSILHCYERQPFAVRLAAGFAALVRLTLNGTLRRYVSVSWRYGLFFFYPVFLLLGCALGGWLVGALVNWMLPAGPLPWLAAVAVTALLAMVAAHKAHLLLMMDDWAFAANLATGADPVTEAMRLKLRSALAIEMASSPHDEVLAIGHSLGCVFAVDSLAASGLSGGRRPALMTAGSSLMKIALHPAAGWLVRHIRDLTGANVRWLDVQALTDVISFFRSNPATTAGVTTGLAPKTLAIRFKSMLSSQSYRRGKYNLFRTHRQFVLAAGRRYAYSMHMIACGPVPFETIWSDGGLPLSSGLFGATADGGA